MNLVPLSDNVIVKPDPKDKVTKGGIHIPDVAKEVKDVRFGKVIAVGPGKAITHPIILLSEHMSPDGLANGLDNLNRPLPVKDGDYVMYGAYAGHPFKQEGEEFVALEESDIIAVVK